MRDPDAQGKKIFLNYTRFSAAGFLYILEQIQGRIKKQDTNYRQALPPALKLACTLRYLATGDSFHSLGYAFNVAHNTVSKFVPEVCKALVEGLQEQAFPGITTPEEWREVANRFWGKWQMPHCVGALDGKHVRVYAPQNSGTLYYNYKTYFSIPLLALVDADYRFLWVDLGGLGHMSDAQIFNQSDLCHNLDSGNASLPAPCPLTDHPEDKEDVPFFIVADDAFALKPHVQKPFNRRKMDPRQKVFNYRLSRARRVVENAFGVMAMRFRIFMRPIETRTENTLLTIKAAVTLHNILMKKDPLPARVYDRESENGDLVEGEWRQLICWKEGPTDARLGRAGGAGLRVREQLADFFGSPQGAVPWQWRMTRLPDPEADQQPQAEQEPAAEQGPHAEEGPSSDADEQ